MKLLFTPPFDSPIPPACLSEDELFSIFAEYGIARTENPDEADFELAGEASAREFVSGRSYPWALPIVRVIIVDGEPAQPEYVLPHYGNLGFAAVFTPMNLSAYADNYAFYMPPRTDPLPGFAERKFACQLATYRSHPGNANSGSHMVVQLHDGVWCHRVLCNERVKIGPEIGADIYGRGWPEGAHIVEDSRAGSNFVTRRGEISAQYKFDICLENMLIPNYTTEKFWSAVQSGALPVYWPNETFRGELPPDSYIDVSEYWNGHKFAINALRWRLNNMLESEWQKRVYSLCRWYATLSRERNVLSWRNAARMLAEKILELRNK